MAVPGINGEYITQVSEEIEGRGTMKLSQEFSRTKNRILNTLPILDKVLLNSQIRAQLGDVPGASENSTKENQDQNEDSSQVGLRAEVNTSIY